MKKLTLCDYKKRYGDAGEFIMKYKHTCKKLPWVAAYDRIKGRCANQNSNKYEFYGGRGIKCSLVPTEIKAAFFRDMAYLQKEPSVDRVDPSKDYTRDNIRWVEFDFNRRSRGIDHPDHAQEAVAARDEILEIIKKLPWTVGMKKSLLRRIYNEMSMRPKL